MVHRLRQNSTAWDSDATALSRVALERFTDDSAILSDQNVREGLVAAVSICPLPGCSSILIEYRTCSSVRLGHPEDWVFACSMCGMVFTVVQGDLILQFLPTQWLSTDIHAA